MTSATAGTAPPRVRLARPGRVLDVARARLRRPGIDRDTADAVLGRYGFGASGGVENLPFGWRNRSVVVRTPRGRWVLKRYRDRWAVLTIVHEHSILQHLETVGFPAVRVASTPAGETLVETDRGRFALFGFEEGVNVAGYVLPRRRRLRLWGDAGRLLARLHRDVEGFVPAGSHHLGFVGADGERARDLAWHLRALEGLARAPDPAAGGEVGDHARWLRGNAARVADRIVALDRTLAEAPLARSVIHGDYGIHNLLVHRDGSLTLHDFELARLDWRLVDLVAVLSRIPPRSGKAFLDGYDAVSGTAGEERRFLSEVWQHYRLCGAVGSWSTYARFGGERRLLTARRRIEEADRISLEGIGAWVEPR